MTESHKLLMTLIYV